VTHDQFVAVQKRLQRLEDSPYNKPGQIRAPRQYILAGKLTCDQCGARMVVTNGAPMKSRPWGRTAIVVCPGFETSACENPRTYDMAMLQTGLVAAAIEMLKLRPAAADEVPVPRALNRRDRSEIKRQIARIDKELSALLEAVISNGPPSENKERMSALIAEREGKEELLTNSNRKAPAVDADSILADLETVLVGLPRGVKSEPPEIQSACERVRCFLLSCSIVPQIENGRFGFKMTTAHGACCGKVYCRFDKLGLASELALELLRKMPHGIDRPAADRAVINAGFNRSNGLRCLRGLENYGLAERRGDRWYATGKQPMVIRGQQVQLKVELDPLPVGDQAERPATDAGIDRGANISASSDDPSAMNSDETDAQASPAT
jgi:hypothetical protein